MNQLWQFGSKSEEEINAEIEENVSNNTKNTQSTFIPKRNNNSFDCRIEDDQITKKYFAKTPWNLTNSLEANLNELIVDQRWEEMKTYKTEYVTDDGTPLKFTTVLSTLKFNLNIPFSIRTEKEAHIFLCDGEDPHESNCYWFMLQAFDGNETAIRKCSKKSIPKINNEYPQEECKKKQVNIWHPDIPRFLNSTQWTHLNLTKRAETLRLLQKDGYKSRQIIEFSDKEEVINVTHMIVHSKMVNTLWKIHQVEFIYTNEETDKVQLGPTFSTTEDYICVSMYLLMCDSCKVKLTLLDANNVNVIEQDFNQIVSSEWREIKFISECKQYQHNLKILKLLVSTIGGTRDQRFWAIDRVRLCQKQEFRMIGLTKKGICQLMSDNKKIIALRDPLQVSESKCPENTIGEFCVPCEWIYENCKQIKICDNDKCVCSSGYDIRSKNCYSRCGYRQYGHGCKKSCGKCNNFYSDCNNIDGTCSPCTDGFSGPTCDIPPSIIFARPPDVTDIKYTEATVQVTDFTLESTSNETASAYTIQYKVAPNKNSNWITHNFVYPFNIPYAIVINNLKADTIYFVRGVIIIRHQYEKYYLGSHLKFKEFTTYCEEISLDNVEIKSTNITAFVSLKTRIKNTVCKLKKYHIYLHETGKRGSFDNAVVYFDGLDPFTHYTIIFQRNTEDHQKKKFQTTEGVPQQVSNLRVANKSSSTICIKWEKPYSINGVFKHYIVKYRHVSHLACKQQPTTPSAEHTLRVTETSTTIKDLIPYSRYSISVFTENTKLKGLPSEFLEETLPADEIAFEEIPEVTVTPGTRGVNIKLSRNCEKIRGQFVVNTTVICINEWCKNQNRTPKTTNHYVSDQIITLDELTPFSDYSLDLIFCRSYTNCEGNIKRETFRTKPTVPNAVSDLLVYTKNESSASLRWKPPDPPNGLLQKYQIKYDNAYLNEHRSKKEFETTSCKLWSDFHCVTVSNLQRGVKYTFQVNGKNEDVSELGPAISTNTTTEIEPSREPYDLNITWTINNDLILQWKHPNESNGPIKYFNIILNGGETNKIEKNLSITNDIYYLNYNFKINSTEMFPSTLYTFGVSAFNSFPGHYVYKTDTSPPDIPLLNADPESDSKNNTITLKISLQKPRGKTDNRLLYILIPDKNNLDSDKFEKFGLKNVKIAANCTLEPSKTSFSVNIGNAYQFDNCYQTNNLSLEPATFYNITILLLHIFQNKSSHNIYSFMYKTLDGPVHFQKILLGLLVLLLLIPVIGYFYVKIAKILKSPVNLFRRNNTSRFPPGNQNDETSTTADIYSKKVEAGQFLNYLKTCMKTKELEKEHQMILNRLAKSTYATLHGGSLEYVDVQFANGRLVEKGYVTSTIPKKNEIDSFWKTIWDENIYNIVLFDTCHINDLKTFENYWPEFNQEVHSCDISIRCVFEETFATYQCRRFIIHYENLTRQVDQIQFSLLSNKKVLYLSLNYAEFFKKVSEIPLGCNSPILVHSSSGMHGSTFALLCDICLRTSKKDGVVDVLGNLERLTEYNTNFVIDCDHYVLAHLVVLENLLRVNTSINCNSLDMSRTHLFTADETEIHLSHLKDTLWMDAATRRVERDSNVYFRTVSPLDEGKVFFDACTLDKEISPCWNQLGTISVDSFRCPNKFLVIPQPTSKTLSAMWHLVFKKNISLILSLNEITPWSTNVPFLSGNKKAKMCSNVKVKPKLTRDFRNYEWTTLELSNRTVPKKQIVEILSMTTWSAKTSCPLDVSDFVNFCIAANDRMKGSGSVMVTCCDGVTASGLFTAMSYNMELMKTNGMCDVCTSVRTVRRHCPQFVNDKKQYSFLVEAAHRYINECKLYEVRYS
ncbi:receptor-type tyrosine-protein phosphatase U-like isoform X5 [Tenebrio molitor]|uniref:receptor-type tyrosine-protein phosphatase U-like isoform X5 n=1 Tax=Tenebrio molitor TaxID=7067 RepID=UPI0036249D0A